MCGERLLAAVYLRFPPAFGGLIVLLYALLVKAGEAKFLFNLFRFLNLSVSLSLSLSSDICRSFPIFCCLFVGGG